MNIQIVSFALVGFLFPSMLFAETRYESVVRRMDALAERHPEKADVFDLGENDLGEIIKGIRLGAKDSSGQPQMLVVAAHHGNEVESVDIAMQFIEDLLSPSADTRLNDAIVYVFPVLNVNGYNRNRREEAHRNGGIVDSNRDYPDPCRKDQPFRLKSTKLLADFFADKQIVSAMSIHGYIGTFTFPWGTFTTQVMTPDHDEFRHLAQQAVAQNGYRYGTHNELIYATTGALEDWAYYEHGVWTALLEIRRRPDVERDARAVTEFLALAPRTRSSNHEHTGSCVKALGPIRSRP